MNTGMMWFDNDPKTSLTAKIERARDYYMHKYYRMPNMVLVHPSMLENPPAPKGASPQMLTHLGGIVVRPYRSVLPGHLWIGIEEKADASL